jgi:Zn-dependent M28 family amino/carboxypeptidase
MKNAKYSLVLTIPLLLLSFCLLSGQDNTDPIDSITIDELRDHLFFLASDALQGRLVGSEGFSLAAEFAASQFRSASVPALNVEKDNVSGYFNTIDFETSTFAESTYLKIIKDGNEQTLKFNDEFIIFSKATGIKVADFTEDLIFLGHGIHEPKYGWDDYKGIDAKGKIVMIAGGAPMKDGKPVLPEDLHKTYSSFMTSGNKVLYPAEELMPKAIIIVLNEEILDAWEPLAMRNSAPVKRVAGEPSEVVSAPAIIFVKPETVKYLITGTGFDLATRTGSYRTGFFKDTQIEVAIKYNDSTEDFSCKNVVAIVEGSDPVLKDEYVVVSAHLDHLGINDDGFFPGADDNGSGSVAVLEAAEAMALSKPRRSVVFVLYTYEEGGTLGSLNFVNNSPIDINKVVLNINADMVGRDSEPFPDDILALASKQNKEWLLDFIVGVNDSGPNVKLNMDLNFEDENAHASRSDQLAFNLRNIPSILVTRGFMGPDYHEITDVPETINYQKVRDSAKLIYSLALEAANLDELFK